VFPPAGNYSKTLPDSTSDPEGSQGHVAYALKQLDGVEEYTVVENTAHIIFDLNPAIVTNTVNNTLVHTLGTEAPTAILEINEDSFVSYVYPNPIGDNAVFTIEGDPRFSYDLELVDLSGRTVRKWVDLSGSSISLATGELESGIYFLNVRDVGGSLMGALELVKE